MIVSFVTYDILRDMKFLNYWVAVLDTAGSLTIIVPKHLIDLFAISALTSVTYSLSSFTISYILFSLDIYPRI